MEQQTGGAFDRERFLAAESGDILFARELAGTFLEVGPGYLEKIRSAVAAGDSVALQRSAHKMKGALGTFFAEPARLAAYALENAGRENRLAEAPRLLQELEERVSELISAFELFMTDD